MTNKNRKKRKVSFGWQSKKLSNKPEQNGKKKQKEKENVTTKHVP